MKKKHLKTFLGAKRSPKKKELESAMQKKDKRWAKRLKEVM
jgi:hypothetical protein